MIRLVTLLARVLTLMVAWAILMGVPVLVFDARERGSVRDALLVVLEQALARSQG